MEKLGNCISLSENDWTDNKLYIKWLKKCFEPYIKSQLYGKYWLLIINDYASHISSEFTTFAQKHKIIYLYLSLHLTNLLQILDINIFDSLKQNYKRLLSKKNSFFNL